MTTNNEIWRLIGELNQRTCTNSSQIERLQESTNKIEELTQKVTDLENANQQLEAKQKQKPQIIKFLLKNPKILFIAYLFFAGVDLSIDTKHIREVSHVMVEIFKA